MQILCSRRNSILKKTKVVPFGYMRHWDIKMNMMFISLKDCFICCKGQKYIKGSEKTVLSYHITTCKIQESASFGLAVSRTASQRR